MTATRVPIPQIPLTSDSVLFCPKKLLIGAYYPVKDDIHRSILPPGVMRRDHQWRNEDTGERLEAFARFMGERRAPICGEFYISGAIPEGYCASCDYKAEHPIGELSFVSRRAVEILTPFETP